MINALELRKLSKSFGDVIANNRVDLDLRHGEVLSLLGENGSGKTTLMNMVAGIYRPDHGRIFVDGHEAIIKSPKDSLDHHIGMIHQHYKLVDVFTAAENIVLGMKEEQASLRFKTINQKVKEIAEHYGFNIDPKKKIYEMSVSEKQTVEIIKVLYRGANILILDEPTAVLTPQENKKLFDIIRNMKKEGKAIIIITHKLNEVMEVSDRVAILRKGQLIKQVDTKDVNEQMLTEMMVGKPVNLSLDCEKCERRAIKLKVNNLTVKDIEGVTKVDNVSFEAYGGEILGVAGIAGSGQKELLEAIAGLEKVEKNSEILFYDSDNDAMENNVEPQNIAGLLPREIMEKGIYLAFIPEDRLGMGLVGSMNITSNVMLRSYINDKSFFMNFKKPKEIAQKIVDELAVATPDIDRTPLSSLSGGNVQKVLVGREIEIKPKVLMSAYAVRGLDINTSYTIYYLLNDEKMKGEAVIYVGEDLDVLLQLCDRIMILCDGKVSGIFKASELTKEKIGLYMTKVGG